MSFLQYYRCINAPRGKRKKKEDCLEEGALPVFTSRVVDATRGHPQPEWLCRNCRRGVKRVHALTGERR
jgi:hypothetical protein